MPEYDVYAHTSTERSKPSRGATERVVVNHLVEIVPEGEVDPEKTLPCAVCDPCRSGDLLEQTGLSVKDWARLPVQESPGVPGQWRCSKCTAQVNCEKRKPVDWDFSP